VVGAAYGPGAIQAACPGPPARWRVRDGVRTRRLVENQRVEA